MSVPPSSVSVDFVEMPVTGLLRKEEALALVRHVRDRAALLLCPRILLDLREADVQFQDAAECLSIALHAQENDLVGASVRRSLRVAALVPRDRERILTAAKVENALRMLGINYLFFTDRDAALDWLETRGAAEESASE